MKPSTIRLPEPARLQRTEFAESPQSELNWPCSPACRTTYRPGSPVRWQVSPLPSVRSLASRVRASFSWLGCCGMSLSRLLARPFGYSYLRCWTCFPTAVESRPSSGLPKPTRRAVLQSGSGRNCTREELFLAATAGTIALAVGSAVIAACRCPRRRSVLAYHPVTGIGRRFLPPGSFPSTASHEKVKSFSYISSLYGLPPVLPFGMIGERKGDHHGPSGNHDGSL